MRKSLVLAPLPQPNSLQQRAAHGLQDDVGLGPRKVDQAQPRAAGLVLGRPDDAVHRAPEVPAAQELERVGDVDDDGIPRRPDVPPLALGRLHLQARDRLVEQERERVVVGMPPRPDVAPRGVLAPRPGEVLHVAQVLEPLGVVAVPPDEEVLVVQLQHAREEPEEGEEEPVVDLEGEGPDLVPVVPDDLGVGPLVLGRELGDVVPLVVVAPGELAGGLGLVAPEVARGRVALVLELLLEGQGEDGLAKGVLAFYLSICEAVADYVEEAWVAYQVSDQNVSRWRGPEVGFLRTVLVDEAEDLFCQGLFAARLVQL